MTSYIHNLGRLALARRFDCPAVMGDHGKEGYFHSFVLYSDDHGGSWTVGQLAPQGWTECQVAELKNGSLLMTSRMYGKPWLSTPPRASDLRRGFARCAFSGNNLRSRMPLDPTHVRLKRTCV
jgi:hypothetical protein